MITKLAANEPFEPMIPVKLSLNNFLSYGENSPDLNFKDFNIACLSGKNGHGKSALLDAMTWALWGQCRASNRAELIRRGALSANVEFDFEVSGVNYRIIRSIKQNKGRATSTMVDMQRFDPDSGEYKPLQQGKLVQAELEKTLKLDFNSFICSSFILQGRADEFLKRAPAERKEILGNILNLARYDIYSKKAREHTARIQADITSESRQIESHDQEIAQKLGLESDLKEHTLHLNETSKHLSKTELYYRQTLIKAESAKADINKLAELKSERDGLISEQLKVSDRLKKLEEQINRNLEITCNEDEIVRGFEAFTNTNEQNNLLSEKSSTLNLLSSRLSPITLAIQNEQKELEKQLGTLEGRQRELSRRLEENKSLIEQKDEIAEGYSSLESLIREEIELETKHIAAEKIQRELAEEQGRLENERIRLLTQRDELKQMIKNLALKLAQKPKIELELTPIEQEIDALGELSKRVEATESELKGIRENYRGLESRINELKKRALEENEKLALVKVELENPLCPLCESPLSIEAKELLIDKLASTIDESKKSTETETKKINAALKTERRLVQEIKKDRAQTQKLPGLIETLGEKKSTIEALSKLALEQKSVQDDFEKLNNEIESNDFGKNLRAEIDKLNYELQSLSYSTGIHKKIKEQLESKRGFQTKKELLAKAMDENEGLRTESLKVEKGLEKIKKVIKEKDFALELRERKNDLEKNIELNAYNGFEHEKVQKELKKLAHFAQEKQELDKAQVRLEHEQREQRGLVKSREQIAEKLAALEHKIAIIKEQSKTYQELDAQRKELEKQLEIIKVERDSQVQKLSSLGTSLKRIEQAENLKKRSKEKTKELAHDLKIYKKLTAAFGKNGIQALIIENAVPEIEHEANNILSKLTEGTMSLSLELTEPTQKGGEKETLQIKVADSTGTRSYDTYSGGEAFRIDFSLRVGISKFIANISGAELRTLIIDEGFGTQDKDGLNLFVDVLQSIKDDFDKIIVITHIDELKDKFPVRIEVVKHIDTGSTFELTYN